MAEVQVYAHTPQLEPQELKVKLITDFDQFRAVASEWDELVARAGIEHLFLSHTWLTTWWECFGSGKQLHIVTVRTARNELVGAAPLMITAGKMYGIPCRRLESIYNFHTPRCDFIVTGPQSEIYAEIWRAISSLQNACDVVLLSQIPENSPTIVEMTVRAQAAGWKTGDWSAPRSPYIPLPQQYDKFFNSLKRAVRYNLRKRYEKLCATGPVDVEVISDKVLVREAMLDGLRIEAAAWKGAAGTAINSDPAVTEFYIRMAERAAELGCLQLTFLRVSGRRIAFDYILRWGKTINGVKIGYDPEYHTYSPGNMLLNLIVQEACKQGIEEYDFLGVDDDWKFEWTKESRGQRWLFLFGSTWRSRLLHTMKFKILPRVKKFRQVSK